MDSVFKNLHINDISNKLIVDSLPDIFFLYEKKEDQFYLKLWNKNHEIVTGYSGEELQDKPALDFFEETEHENIIKALGEVFRTGIVKHVFGNLKLKNGDTIPYLFEGYQFDKGDRSFFMGTGINISSLQKQEKKLRKVTRKLSKKERELFSILIEKEKENVFTLQVTRELNKILLKNDLHEIKKDLKRLKTKLIKNEEYNDRWEIFKKRFNNVNPTFFKTLKERFPALTKNDLKYCAYLKIHLSGEQIASLQNISKEGIKKRRYRLKKKLGLPKNISIEDLIETL